MEWRHCSGTMHGGFRQCYFKATIKVGSRWYCKKCVRVMARSKIQAKKKPKPKLKPLPEEDLVKLFRVVKRSKAEGRIDNHSARELVLNIFPLVLRELFHLRGLKEP